jgi:hypothetical protein
MKNTLTTEQVLDFAETYIMAGFTNPNAQHKITDTIQAQTESKQTIFWRIVDMAKWVNAQTTDLTTNN